MWWDSMNPQKLRMTTTTAEALETWNTEDKSSSKLLLKQAWVFKVMWFLS